MSWEFLSHSFSWNPGQAGKGYVLHDGTIHTWPVDESEAPHHIDEYQQRNEPYPMRFLFDIDPSGGINDGGKGFNNQTGKSEDAVVNRLIERDPRMYDGQPDFDPDLLDENAPTGRDEGYGHAYNLMNSFSSDSFAGIQEHRIGMADELAQWLGTFERAPEPPSVHHEGIGDLDGSPTPSQVGATLYPPGHEPKPVTASESAWAVWCRNSPEDEVIPFGDYLADHNEDDCDNGELDDVSGEQVERWFENWESEGRPGFTKKASDASEDELHVALSLPDKIADEIREWVDEQEWPKGTELEDKSDYHITLLYTHDGHEEHHDAEWFNHTDGYDVEITAIDEFGPDPASRAIVLRIESPDAKLHANDLQDQADNRGLDVSRFPGGYRPHITVAYGPQKPPYARVPKLNFKSGPSSVSPSRTEKESSTKTARAISTHYNQWTGRPCSCPWSKHHREWRRREASVHEAGQQLNKLMRAPDKRLKTPEGQALLERLRQHGDTYDDLYPYIAQRFKKGDIRLKRGVRPDDEASLQYYPYDDDTPDQYRYDWRPLEYDLPNWHRWYQAKQHPTRRGVNVMDPDFRPAHMIQRVQEHTDALRQVEQQQEALRYGQTIHKFPNGWSVKHLNAPTTDTGQPNDSDAAMETEGDIMNHCLGSDSQPYKECARQGKIDAYSLRDPTGLPHVTWHHNSDGSLAEMFGRSDSDIRPEYQDMIDQYDPSVNKDNEEGHNESAYDQEVTIPGPDNLEDYHRSINGDYEYPEGTNVGDDTEINEEEPRWDDIAGDYHHEYTTPDERRRFFNTIINFSGHFPDADRAISGYPIDYPHEQAAQDQWQQMRAPHYHPLTGEFVQPQYGNTPSILDQYQRPLFTPNMVEQPNILPPATTPGIPTFPQAQPPVQDGYNYASSWHFGHQLEWTKGQSGKGLLYPDNTLQTWNINDYGEPHHLWQAGIREDDVDDLDFLQSGHLPFVISPEGEISHSWNETGEIPQGQVGKIVMQDTRLYPGTVKGQQYGHGFAFARLAHYERQLMDIANAYRAAPMYDPRAAPAWHELAADSRARADEIRRHMRVSITDDPEPYPDAHAMIADIRNNNNFIVSRANSEHPIWTPDQNVDFRIVHDVLGHNTSGGDFSWEGENRACAAHFPLLTPQAQRALFTECIAQTGYANANRGFGPQKVSFLNDFQTPYEMQNNQQQPQQAQPEQPLEVQSSVPSTQPESFCHRHMRHGIWREQPQADTPYLGALQMPDPPRDIWGELGGNTCILCGNPARDDVCLDCANTPKSGNG